MISTTRYEIIHAQTADKVHARVHSLVKSSLLEDRLFDVFAGVCKQVDR